jgi:hypothetical protein
MAGDWIKMRVGLTTHPRVLRIAECLLENNGFLVWSGLSFGVTDYSQPSEERVRTERHAALRVTRYVTVTALLKFWGYANEHAKGEFIAGLWPEDVDEISGVPGFSEAMQDAGWVEFDPKVGGLSMPNFEEHNTTATVRNSAAAERQKRYRERQKLHVTDDDSRDVTRDVTVTPREEKRREEKKEKGAAEAGADSSILNAKQLIAEGVDPQIAQDWLKVRRAKKAPLTQTAWNSVKAEAAKAGMTPAQAVKHSAENVWQGFKASWLTDVRGMKPVGANGDAYRGNEL